MDTVIKWKLVFSLPEEQLLGSSNLEFSDLAIVWRDELWSWRETSMLMLTVVLSFYFVDLIVCNVLILCCQSMTEALETQVKSKVSIKAWLLFPLHIFFLLEDSFLGAFCVALIVANEVKAYWGSYAVWDWCVRIVLVQVIVVSY